MFLEIMVEFRLREHFLITLAFVLSSVARLVEFL